MRERRMNEMKSMVLYHTVIAALFAMLLQGFAVAEPSAADAPSPADDVAPRVEFYSSAGCAYCRMLRAYLRARGISYLEHNINATLETREAFYAMGGQGTPLVLIGSCRIHGFNPVALEAALAAKSDC